MIAGDRRTGIRNAMKTHMKVDRVSAGEISRHINAHQSTYGGEVSRFAVSRFIDVKQGKVGDDKVSILEHYLRDVAPTILHEAVEALEEAAAHRTTARLRHRLFPAASAFFHVHPQEVVQNINLFLGEYTFYAYSEKDEGKVCRGAIQFYVDKTTKEFSARELQESISAGTREEYTGLFFFREKEVLVMLRDKVRATPKFYLLSILSWPDMSGRYTLLEGAILKIGEQKSVFSHNICMVRDAAAFTRCGMLKVTEVGENIVEFLNSRKWGAPHEARSLEGFRLGMFEQKQCYGLGQQVADRRAGRVREGLERVIGLGGQSHTNLILPPPLPRLARLAGLLRGLHLAYRATLFHGWLRCVPGGT
jgi:hypothetical protein